LWFFPHLTTHVIFLTPFRPALDIVFANLELMPLRMNERKIAGIGDRQRDMVARRFLQAGLLSRKGLEPVLQ